MDSNVIATPKLVGIKDLIRDRLSECTKTVSNRFRQSVRPIYGATKESDPVHIGSCVLVRRRQTSLLLTAAHVLDHSQFVSLFLLANSTFVPIEGQFWATPKPEGGREADKFDVAISPISPSMLKALEGVTFIEDQDIYDKPDVISSHTYLALGFPNSKQKQKPRRGQTKVFPSRLWKYTASIFDKNPLPAERGFSDENHIFVKFDRKRSIDSNWKPENSLNPTGASGGALFDMGNLSDMNLLASGAPCKGLLIGILIENPMDGIAIVATRIQTILPLIDQVIRESKMETE